MYECNSNDRRITGATSAVLGVHASALRAHVLNPVIRALGLVLRGIDTLAVMAIKT